MLQTADDLLALIQPDAQAVADGARRMAACWRGEPTDSLPIVFGAPVPEAAGRTTDMVRHVADPEAMLADWAVGLVGLARAGSDAQLTMRVDTGTGTLATAAGCAMTPTEVGLPWFGHVDRATVEAFDPTVGLAEAGLLPTVQAWYGHLRARLPACVQLFCADTQGPFDLAHLLLGDELFTLLYDDPAFAHAVLRKATTLYIEGTRLMKGWIGEPLDGGYHWSIALADGGVRACMDTDTLLSPALIEEFCLPYLAQALAPFGGGYVHYCGHNPALYRGLLAIPQVRGLNFGNPERHDMAQVLSDLLAAGKCYFGAIPRQEGEALEPYFRRVAGYTQGRHTGLIFQPSLTPEEAAAPAAVIGLWRAVQ